MKKLSDGDMQVLAGEIRSKIIATVAENGGHLASNLGMVEATLALHHVFNCTAEKQSDAFIFDVGHQCYAHKLLTGRYSHFQTLRKPNGLSGFTNREESPFDMMTCGHSGSSISAAMGVAEANRLKYGNTNAPWVVAIVGDGSFTNGMIFEALNSLADRNLKLIILLNDNEMSISRNVGGLSKYLSYIRTSESYFTFKLVLKRTFSAVPLVGNHLVNLARGIKNFLKRATNSESLFENLGLEYIGPVNGNDYQKMVHVLEEAKMKNAPVIVHMKTRKGMGYPPAEGHPERYHSASPFDVATGEVKKDVSGETYTAVFSETLCKISAENDKICAITAAMTDGCGLYEFSRRFSARFFDVGIAEEHAAALAGGLAMAGMVPVLVLYSTFSQRIFDQLWHDIRLQNAHVVMVLSHSGLVPGDGVTHQGIYDVAIFKSIPGITVFSPDTTDELRTHLAAAISGDGLCIVRYPKDVSANYNAVNFTRMEGDGFVLKRASFESSQANKNTTLLVFTYGRISRDAAAVLQDLTDCGISSELMILEQILPLPAAQIREIAESGSFGAAITIEEGVEAGGLGESIAAELAKFTRIPVHTLAISDPLLPHGTLDHIKRLSGLDRESLKKRILERILS